MTTRPVALVPDVTRMVVPAGTRTLRWPPGDGLRVVGVAQGTIRVRSRSGDRALTLVRGDLVQEPGGQVLEMDCDVISTEAGVLLTTVVSRSWLSAVLGAQVRRVPSLDAPSLRRLGEHDPSVAMMLGSLWSGVQRNSGREYLEAVARHLAAHLLEVRLSFVDGVPSGAFAGPSDGDQLDSIIRYMREHVAEPITLDQLAAVIGYSRYHFVRRFTAWSGRTPYRFLTDLRIDLARSWLETSDDAVSYVGRQCGFPNPQHFSRVFRERVGMTPAEYRRSRKVWQPD